VESKGHLIAYYHKRGSYLLQNAFLIGLLSQRDIISSPEGRTMVVILGLWLLLEAQEQQVTRMDS